MKLKNKDFELIVTEIFKDYDMTISPHLIEINLDGFQSKVIFTSYTKSRNYSVHSCGIKFPCIEIKQNYEKETLQIIKDSLIPNIIYFYKQFREINMIQAIDVISYVRNTKINNLLD